MPEENSHSLQAPCPWAVKDRLAKFCARTGRKETDVIVEAVTRFLDDPSIRPHSAYRELMKKIGDNPAQSKPLAPPPYRAIR